MVGYTVCDLASSALEKQVLSSWTQKKALQRSVYLNKMLKEIEVEATIYRRIQLAEA